MLNFTGAVPASLKSSAHCLPGPYLPEYNLRLDRMQLPWGRYSGTHLKDAIRRPGKPNGGWNPEELRTIQDFYVKYSLSTAEGVSEVASVGGFIKEYQVDLNPDALKAYNVSVMDVMNAVKNSNLDIGAETIELNNVEYIIRGPGLCEKP